VEPEKKFRKKLESKEVLQRRVGRYWLALPTVHHVTRRGIHLQHAYAASSRFAKGPRRFVNESCMFPLAVVEAFYPLENIKSLSLWLPYSRRYTHSTFNDLKMLPIALLSQQFARRLMDCSILQSSMSCRNNRLTYWLPRSLYTLNPGAGFRVQHADLTASQISSAVMRILNNQPTRRRFAKSILDARYSDPPPVRS
jgi:hypothetical protein